MGMPSHAVVVCAASTRSGFLPRHRNPKIFGEPPIGLAGFKEGHSGFKDSAGTVWVRGGVGYDSLIRKPWAPAEGFMKHFRMTYPVASASRCSGKKAISCLASTLL